MFEWLLPIVLVVAIAGLIVVSFGFVGCDLVWGLDGPDPPPPEPVWTKTFEMTLPGSANRKNRTLVVRIGHERLSVSGSQVRVHVQRPATADLNISNAYISHAADNDNVDSYVSASTPTLLSGPVLVENDSMLEPTVQLGPVDFAFDELQSVLIALDIGDSGEAPRSDGMPGAGVRTFISPVGLAEGAAPSMGYQAENRIHIVALIEVA